MLRYEKRWNEELLGQECKEEGQRIEGEIGRG